MILVRNQLTTAPLGHQGPGRSAGSDGSNHPSLTGRENVNHSSSAANSFRAAFSPAFCHSLTLRACGNTLSGFGVPGQ